MKTALKALLLAFLMSTAGIVIAGQAHADCLSVAGLKTALLRDVPGIVVETFAGNDGRDMLRFINATPPQTNVEADEMLAAGKASAPMVVIIFFKAGCAQGRTVLPVPFFERFKKEIEKGKA